MTKCSRSLSYVFLLYYSISPEPTAGKITAQGCPLTTTALWYFKFRVCRNFKWRLSLYFTWNGLVSITSKNIKYENVFLSLRMLTKVQEIEKVKTRSNFWKNIDIFSPTFHYWKPPWCHWIWSHRNSSHWNIKCKTALYIRVCLLCCCQIIVIASENHRVINQAIRKSWNCHTWRQLGISAKLRIWQVPAFTC